MSASSVRIAAAAALSVVLGMLPPLMLGATAVLVREDLGFDQRRLGLIMAAYFTALGLTALPFGALADRVGPRRSLLTAVTASAVAIAGVTAAPSSGWLAVAMGVGGVACGFAMSAASLAIGTGAGARGGFAFGVQQSAVPFTSLLAGIAVPTVALTLGWRWTFGLSLLLVPTIAVVVPAGGAFSRGRDAAGTHGEPPRRAKLPRSFWLVALGMCFASAAALTTSTFLVESLVHRGVGTGSAAVVLAGASSACIATRLYVGWQADRRTGGHVAMAAAMVLLAACGHLVLGGARSLPLLTLGALVAFGVGYGWPGLLFHGVATLHPSGVGAAVGATNAGGAMGAAVGPAVFGVLIASGSHRLAWSVTAGVAALGGLILFAAARATTPTTDRASAPHPSEMNAGGDRTAEAPKAELRRGTGTGRAARRRSDGDGDGA